LNLTIEALELQEQSFEGGQMPLEEKMTTYINSLEESQIAELVDASNEEGDLLASLSAPLDLKVAGKNAVAANEDIAETVTMLHTSAKAKGYADEDLKDQAKARSQPLQVKTNEAIVSCIISCQTHL